MRKPDVVSHVASRVSPWRAQVNEAVSAEFETIQDCLARGESVGATGFGTYSTKSRQGRIGKSPRTGERIAIAASRGPAFKTCRPTGMW